MEVANSKELLMCHSKKRARNRNELYNSFDEKEMEVIFKREEPDSVNPERLDLFCKKETRIVNDMSYGFIGFNDYIWKLIDTKHVQRLRYLTQLGSLFWVFPSADFSRFEHSLGVAHMAEKFTDIALKKGGGKGMSLAEKDYIKESLIVAGLCHDLGHGPFSHVFDGTVMPTL